MNTQSTKKPKTRANRNSDWHNRNAAQRLVEAWWRANGRRKPGRHMWDAHRSLAFTVLTWPKDCVPKTFEAWQSALEHAGRTHSPWRMGQAMLEVFIADVQPLFPFLGQGRDRERMSGVTSVVTLQLLTRWGAS